MFKCSNIPVFKCSTVQMYKFSNVQLFKCSNVPIFQCFNVPMFQCSNVQKFQCSNVQMFKCSNVNNFNNVNNVKLLLERSSRVPPVIFSSVRSSYQNHAPIAVALYCKLEQFHNSFFLMPAQSSQLLCRN